MLEQLTLIDLSPLPIAKPNSSAKGAKAEVEVAATLLGLGFAVFLRLGNGGSPDLTIVGPEGASARIEVKSQRSQHSVKWKDTDLLAVVQNDDISFYWYDYDVGRRRNCDVVTWFQEHAICHADIERRLTELERYAIDNIEQQVRTVSKALLEIGAETVIKRVKIGQDTTYANWIYEVVVEDPKLMGA